MAKTFTSQVTAQLDKVTVVSLLSLRRRGGSGGSVPAVEHVHLLFPSGWGRPARTVAHKVQPHSRKLLSCNQVGFPCPSCAFLFVRYCGSHLPAFFSGFAFLERVVTIASDWQILRVSETCATPGCRRTSGHLTLSWVSCPRSPQSPPQDSQENEAGGAWNGGECGARWWIDGSWCFSG